MPITFYTYAEEGNGLIEFDLKNKSNQEDIEDPFVPTTYYLEALIISIENDDRRESYVIRKLIEYKNLINVLSFAVTECKQYEELFMDFVNKSSRLLNQSIRYYHRGYTPFELFFLDFPEELVEIYQRWREENSALADEIEKKINCVAIAFPSNTSLIDNGNCFFSLNGSDNDYIGTNHIQGWNLKENMRRLYSIVGSLLQRLFGVVFNECHLTDEIVRYVYFSNSNGNLNGKPLKNYISLPKDHKQRGRNRMFKRHYSCCEKKITTAMKFVNYDYPKLVANTNPINILSSYTFKVLKEPCRMCRPALIGCYNIFYYEDNDDYTHCFKISYDNSNLRTPLLVEKI